ncbi:MAG: arginine--tRNA ligase, partial [Pirellulaceae bacterium]|nr:arginine--tRNA ligase [Pirellulaceae bacterium]
AVLQETVKLHAGDTENRQLWSMFLPECRTEIRKIYNRLDIEFDYELGESFYQPMLGPVVKEFQEKGLATESDGAICLFLEGFDAPMIIQKKDGAFLYATTDLATIKYRMDTWEPDAILYVVDHRQGEHFDKLFAAAKKWGYGEVELHHVRFGTVLGEDNKPYKTRSGDAVGLEGLLDRAVEKTAEILKKNEEATNGDDRQVRVSEQQEHVASILGHAAIKYADLSHNRTSDYVFSYEKMTATEGNTAAYMQYAYARVQSIFAKGEYLLSELCRQRVDLSIDESAERALAISLLRFGDALQEVTSDYQPNHLTNYLFQLSKDFSAFYSQCKILGAEKEEQKQSRLRLCALTARVLREGLQLLGMKVVDRM